MRRLGWRATNSDRDTDPLGCRHRTVAPTLAAPRSSSKGEAIGLTELRTRTRSWCIGRCRRRRRFRLGRDWPSGDLLDWWTGVLPDPPNAKPLPRDSPVQTDGTKKGAASWLHLSYPQGFRDGAIRPGTRTPRTQDSRRPARDRGRQCFSHATLSQSRSRCLLRSYSLLLRLKFVLPPLLASAVARPPLDI